MMRKRHEETGFSRKMFSVPHLIVIFVVALIVFGPEKLPELARNLGKFMAEFRRVTGEVRYTFDEHMREIERESAQRKSGAAAGTPVPAENTIASKAPRGMPAATDPASSGESHEPGQADLFDGGARSAEEEAKPSDESPAVHASNEADNSSPEQQPGTVNDGHVRPA
jgi:TatA/E family protein of Tat protein translocase